MKGTQPGPFQMLTTFPAAVLSGAMLDLGELVGTVDLAAIERVVLGGLVRVVGDDDAVDVRLATSPVVGIAERRCSARPGVNDSNLNAPVPTGCFGS